MTPELITAYLSLRRRLPELPARHALTIARYDVKLAARPQRTVKGRVMTLRAQERWEARKGGRQME